MLKKPWVLPATLSAIIIILAGIVVALLVFMKNQPLQKRGVTPIVDVKAMEPDSSVWGTNFANQYSTLLKTETNNVQTKYGGSDPVSKLEVDPRLVKLFAGYGFSIDYNEERGHMNSLADVRNTKRVNEKTPATCYSCKSSNNPALWDEMGMAAYDKMLFSDMTPKLTESIGCANCHEAGSMRLIVTNPALDEALKAQGKDWRTFTRQEMRTVVCANCHVEYYFKGDGKYLTFPWENGTKIEDIDAYYQAISFTDWTHKESATPMIKMQHPEYEFFTAGSTHYEAGVSCADCHMPYTRDGAVKFSTHDVQSPAAGPGQFVRRMPHRRGLCDRTGGRDPGPGAYHPASQPRMPSARQLTPSPLRLPTRGRMQPWSTQPASCTARRNYAGISSLPKTAWGSTTLKKHCASWLLRPTWLARPRSKPCWPS